MRPVEGNTCGKYAKTHMGGVHLWNFPSVLLPESFTGVSRLAPSAFPLRESLQRLVEQQSFCLKDLLLRRRPLAGGLSCCRHPISKRGDGI